MPIVSQFYGISIKMYFPCDLYTSTRIIRNLEYTKV